MKIVREANMIKPLVTVIIPIYNIERYLACCVHSLINQTYSNLEIILVDDGSPDECPEICDELSLKDNRIKVIHKKNGGLSAARNTGIEVATGKYVMFVDGDDWIETNCIEECVNAIETKNSTDIVLFPYIKEYKEHNEKVSLFKDEVYYFDEKETKDTVLKRLFGPSKPINPVSIDNISTAWGKLYRKSIIVEIEFTDTKKIGVEDSYYNIQAFYNARCCKYISNTFYHYNKTNDNSLTKNFDLKNAYLRENMYLMKRKFIEDKSLSSAFNIALNNRIIVNLFGIVYSIVNSSSDYKTKVLDLETIVNREIYLESFSEFNFNSLENKWRPFYWMCKYKKSKLLIFVLNKLVIIRNRGV